MYNFFERKGLKMREPNKEDKQKATAMLRSERSLNLKGKPIEEIKRQTKNKNALNIDNVVLSIIGKDYFTKLAVTKGVFSESTDFSRL